MNDSTSNLPAVGDQDLLEHALASYPTAALSRALKQTPDDKTRLAQVRSSEEMEPTVFSLAEARLQKRLKSYRERLDRVLSANQHAVSRLFQTGSLFTKEGTRAGRDLLLAHQHLLRVVTLLDRLSQNGDVPAPRQAEEVDAIFCELDELLEKTGQLTERTGALFRGRGE